MNALLKQDMVHTKGNNKKLLCLKKITNYDVQFINETISLLNSFVINN